MKKLNLRTPKSYDYSDTEEKQKLRSKFFCVSEGPTEESYFLGIKNNKRELKIKNDVYIEIVEKEKGQESYSHPMQLVMACLQCMGRLDMDEKDIPEEEWEKNCKWKEYDPEIDTVCIIFDRDYRDLEKCLDNIYEKCRKHKIYIAISNPNFELWLLLHFSDIGQYDKEMLLRNPKNVKKQIFSDASKNKKYLEIVLSKVAEGYKKGSSIKFEKYKEFVPLAIEQAKLFSEDSEKLKNELGTSVGKLIEKMQE